MDLNMCHKIGTSSDLVCVFGTIAAAHATFLEQILLTVVIGVPIIGAFAAGYGSLSLIYGYVLMFDCLRCLGHSNVEMIPHQIFDKISFLRYIIYTPT